jgi:protein-S-isoprenylcysteine O-methyltransferase Ste14
VQTWAALLATLSIGGSLFAQRIYLEEALMKSELGASYVDYMARTKRFVPFVW